MTRPTRAAADFTIADVLAWARTKPADERYEVYSAGICALGQFGTATDRAYLHTCYAPEHELGIAGLNEALGFVRLERTFGALVKRLEALLPETAAAPSEWTHLAAYLTDIQAVSVPA